MRTQYHARKVGPDMHIWDVHRLVRASEPLEVIRLPLTEIAELDENWWYDDPANVPTPRSFVQHMTLVRACDLAYPILLCTEGRLMDGMHRAVKALLAQNTYILARRFPQTPAPDHINVPLAELPYHDQDI